MRRGRRRRGGVVRRVGGAQSSKRLDEWQLAAVTESVSEE